MSAALQAVPATTVSTLNTPPLVPASPSNRPYASSHSSPSREGYHAHQSSTLASPSTSTRPSRRPSGSAAAPASPLANQPPSQSNSPMSSRAALASPVPVASAPGEHRSSSSDRRRNMPPVAPPRTSSTQHGQGAPSSRRSGQAPERRATSPRRSRDPNGNVEPSTRMTNTRDTRSLNESMALPVRSQAAPVASTSPRGPSRESSEILNSTLFSQPEVDIDREKERLVMSQPHHGSDSQDLDDAAPPPIAGAADRGDESRRGGRSRHDHSKREKHSKFGEYILGNTIGEGEFGKVKLGWKQEGGVQVAIKLIKKDTLGNNPSRLNKIMREVAILKQLTHPNIVKLHEMEETEGHFGIILEYASGGELFDYILNHRYLKDNAARRLFAQLVSGVGYLHKKGIVHRDLKLENLLLDRNRNIIITDFGFANTFNPGEELTEEEESGLGDRDFVKRVGLDKVDKAHGWRKGDLMQTSCGSPCYAAPELVVSDSLYTGRKVDVWSCGVILYAMLAGYLPFDDDPANPEGDNINLLYKYIVNTPLTFPEYVTPHARDLLRRILVPNPRKRADLFEVARHSWLSEYAHVVEFITSSTTTPGEIQNTTVDAEDIGDTPMLARSSSVRESSKKSPPVSSAIGGLASKQGTVDAEAEAATARQQRDNKRRTVQVEYVAPRTQTQRGEPSDTRASSTKTRARSGSQGPVEVAETIQAVSTEKPLPKDPPVSKEAYMRPARESRRPPSAHRGQNVGSTRPSREGVRSTSDGTYGTGVGGPSAGRPATRGSMNSTGSKSLASGTRASYGQPLPPTVAGTNAHGRIQQPSGGSKNYVISNPIPQDSQDIEYGRPSISIPSKFARVAGLPEGNTSVSNVPSVGGGSVGGGSGGGGTKGHKRSSTIGEISGKLFGRNGSLFGGKGRKRSEQQQQQQQQPGEKGKKYPPVSMSNTMAGGEVEPRLSIDSRPSRRSFTLGLGKKRSGSMSGSSQEKRHSRRFSLLPQSISRAIGVGRDDDQQHQDSQQELPIHEPVEAQQQGRYIDQSILPVDVEASALDGMYAQLQDPRAISSAGNASGSQNQSFSGQPTGQLSGIPPYMQRGAMLQPGSNPAVNDGQRRPPNSAPYQTEYQEAQAQDGRNVVSRGNRGVLQKNKRFTDAYDTDENSRTHDHAGSSGAARRVMDFFRRRGKARGGEDR